MFGKAVKAVMMILLVGTFIFFSTSCGKQISTLRANYYFSKANHHFSDALYRKAITEYEKALEFNPELGEAYHFLGEAYKNIYRPGVDDPENMEKANKALEALNKAYELYPENKQIIYSLGDMYDKMSNFEEAEKYYLRIIEFEPGNMDNYYVVAEFYKRYAGGSEEKEGEEEVEGKTPFQKAEEMYLRRIEADPESPQGYSYTARFYELPPLNNFDKAKGFYDKLVDLQPDSAEAWLSKGVNRWAKAFRVPNLSKKEKLEAGNEGIKALKKATELDSSYPEPYSWMSVIYESVLAQLEPEKASRYKAEAARARDRYQELRKRAAARARLEEELRRGERER